MTSLLLFVRSLKMLGKLTVLMCPEVVCSVPKDTGLVDLPRGEDHGRHQRRQLSDGLVELVPALLLCLVADLPGIVPV